MADDLQTDTQNSPLGAVYASRYFTNAGNHTLIANLFPPGAKWEARPSTTSKTKDKAVLVDKDGNDILAVEPRKGTAPVVYSSLSPQEIRNSMRPSAKGWSPEAYDNLDALLDYPTPVATPASTVQSKPDPENTTRTRFDWAHPFQSTAAIYHSTAAALKDWKQRKKKTKANSADEADSLQTQAATAAAPVPPSPTPVPPVVTPVVDDEDTQRQKAAAAAGAPPSPPSDEPDLRKWAREKLDKRKAAQAAAAGAPPPPPPTDPKAPANPEPTKDPEAQTTPAGGGQPPVPPKDPQAPGKQQEPAKDQQPEVAAEAQPPSPPNPPEEPKGFWGRAWAKVKKVFTFSGSGGNNNQKIVIKVKGDFINNGILGVNGPADVNQVLVSNKGATPAQVPAYGPHQPDALAPPHNKPALLGPAKDVVVEQGAPEADLPTRRAANNPGNLDYVPTGSVAHGPRRAGRFFGGGKAPDHNTGILLSSDTRHSMAKIQSSQWGKGPTPGQ